MMGRVDEVSMMLSVLVFLSCISGLMAGKGQLFLVAYSKEADNAHIYLSMFLRGQKANADVTVSYPGKPSNTEEEHTIESSKKFKLIQVLSSLIAETSGPTSGNCIKIESTVDISVIAFSVAYKSGVLYSSSSFMVFPLEQLSTYYIAVTSCRLTDCFILVASYEDDTEVKVRVSAMNITKDPPNQASEIVYNGKIHKHGSVFEQKLQAWNSFQIVASTIDLTGTLLSSSKPIAVYSGGVFGKALHSQKQDKMAEQIPPVKSLGKTFVLRGPDFPAAWRYTVRVAKPHPNTTVKLSDDGDHHEVIDSREDQEVFRLDVGETIILKASNPVLVIVGSPEENDLHSNDSDASVDPSFVLAIPESLWINRFRLFIFKPVAGALHYQAVLVTAATCTNEFQMDKVDIEGIHWITAGNYKSGAFTLPDDQSTRRISNANCPFGGYILSYDDAGSWMYPFEWTANIVDREDPGPDLQPLPDLREDLSTSIRTSATPVTSGSPTIPDSSQTVPSANNIPSSTPQDTSTIYTNAAQLTPDNSPTTRDQTNIETEATSTPIHSVTAGGITSTSTMLPSGNTMTRVSERTTTLESSQAQASSAPPVFRTTASQISSTSFQIIQNPTTSTVAQIPTTALSTGTLTSVVNASPSTTTMMQSIPTQTLSQALSSQADTDTILSTSTNQYSIQPSPVADTTSISPEIIEKSPSSNSYTLILCPCECTSDLGWIANLTTEEKEEQTKEIVRTLQVDKSSVSKTIRKKTSAPDERATPVYYGSFITGLVFASLFCLLIGPDFIHASYYIYKVIKQIK